MSIGPVVISYFIPAIKYNLSSIFFLINPARGSSILLIFKKTTNSTLFHSFFSSFY